MFLKNHIFYIFYIWIDLSTLKMTLDHQNDKMHFPVKILLKRGIHMFLVLFVKKDILAVLTLKLTF